MERKLLHRAPNSGVKRIQQKRKAVINTDSSQWSSSAIIQPARACVWLNLRNTASVKYTTNYAYEIKQQCYANLDGFVCVF